MGKEPCDACGKQKTDTKMNYGEGLPQEHPQQRQYKAKKKLSLHSAFPHKAYSKTKKALTQRKMATRCSKTLEYSYEVS